MARKSYGQFCAVARTLDHVGDRWSMLVVRELLLSESTYGELLGALPGIPTNLLSARLRDLEADGLVDRHADHADRRRVRYSLTPSGRDIEPVLLAMIRWGARWMMSGPEDDEFDPRWIELALRALLTDSHMARGERVLVDVLDASPLLITGRSDGRAEVGENDSGGEHDAVITGHASNLLALFSGSWTLSRARRAGVRTRGSRRTLAILLSHEQPSPAA